MGRGLQVTMDVGATPIGYLYQAEYLSTGQSVALLVLPVGGNSASRAAAHLAVSLDQIRRAIGIRHPNVATVYETGETAEGCVYLACEQLEGVLLSEIVAEQGVLPWPEAIDLFQQAVAGLQAAHEAGVVHGNLSPSAMLITTAVAGHRLLKLVRFGASAALAGEGDRPGRPSPYVSPERLAGQPADERSDVFSLGAVLYHLLVGAPPGGQAPGVLPEPVRMVITKALSAMPGKRFSTVAEFGEALERATPRMPVVAIPHRGRRRTAARHGVPGGIAATVVIALASALWLTRSAWDRVDPVAMSEDTIDVAVAALPPSDTADAGPPPPQPPKPPPAQPHAEPSLQRPPEAAAEPARVRPAADSALAAPPLPAADTVSSVPADPVPDPATGITRRISLEEAARQLGTPLHAIDGLERKLVGLVPGKVVPGAIPLRTAVRAVYGDPGGGRPIFLDQQRVWPEEASRLDSVPRPGPAGDQRWIIGDVLLALHGGLSPDSLRALARRVR